MRNGARNSRVKDEDFHAFQFQLRFAVVLSPNKMIGLGFATNEKVQKLPQVSMGLPKTEPPLGIVSLIEVSIARILLYPSTN
jgi:hypothetical protein